MTEIRMAVITTNAYKMKNYKAVNMIWIPCNDINGKFRGNVNATLIACSCSHTDRNRFKNGDPRGGEM
jgi:hypothetical protein